MAEISSNKTEHPSDPMAEVISITKNTQSRRQNFASTIVPVRITKFGATPEQAQQDLVAVEEPLQISIAYQIDGVATNKDLAVTMRTPGHDGELAAGFMFSEGLLQTPEEIARVEEPGSMPGSSECNRVLLELRPGVHFDVQRLERNFYVSSSCGVCGKASIGSIQTRLLFPATPGHPKVAPSIIHEMPETVRHFQSIFEKTGGLHAAALFDLEGHLLSLREDVGRHNAVDKLVGAELLDNNLPLRDHVLFLSGRASFELIQKAAMAGIAVVVAVGAPSSLAVEMAIKLDMTLAGFARGGQFNVYAGKERIVGN
jgi:FdhD protein